MKTSQGVWLLSLQAYRPANKGRPKWQPFLSFECNKKTFPKITKLCYKTVVYFLKKSKKKDYLLILFHLKLNLPKIEEKGEWIFSTRHTTRSRRNSAKGEKYKFQNPGKSELTKYFCFCIVGRPECFQGSFFSWKWRNRNQPFRWWNLLYKFDELSRHTPLFLWIVYRW